MRAQTVALAQALGVVGLINVQFAIKNGVVYVLEVNPRASRTIPFVSKAIGVPLASLAARVMTGESLADIGFTEEVIPPYVAVKEAVFPFSKFREFDPILGPEMRSTGEVMGIADSFGSGLRQGADRRRQLPAGSAARSSSPSTTVTSQTSCRSRGGSTSSGFVCIATEGTRRYLRSKGIPSEQVFKVHEGRPHAIDLIVNRDVQLLINTPLGKHAHRDDYSLRQAAIAHQVPYTTTLSAANAAVDA